MYGPGADYYLGLKEIQPDNNAIKPSNNLVKRKVDILNLHCKYIGDVEYDNVFFNITIDGVMQRYPATGQYNIKVGQTWRVNKSLQFKKSLKIEIWDYEEYSSNFYIGTVNLDSTTTVKSAISLTGSGNQYVIDLKEIK